VIPLLLAAFFAADPQPPALRMRKWDCQTRQHFRVCSVTKADVNSIAAQAETALRDTLQLAGGSRYPYQIYLFVAPSPRYLDRLIHAYANGASHPEEHAVFWVAGHPEDLKHELNHEVVTALWGKSEFWIAEGLAAYAASPDEIDNRCRKTLSEHWSLTLADMVKPDWNAVQDPYPARVIYPMLGSFVKYLKTTYGLDAVRHVWQQGSASIPRVFGKPLADLDREWREVLLRTVPK
jgi:hypothetical protein